MMTVDIVERNSAVPADAKEIWKALTHLFESRMKKKKSLLQVLTYTAEAIIEQYNILSFIAVTVRILLMKQFFHEIFMSPVEF